MSQKVSKASSYKPSKVSEAYIKVSSENGKKVNNIRSTLQSREDIEIKIPELNLTGIDENFINASLQTNILLKEKCARCKALNVFLCEHRTPVRDDIRQKYTYPPPISYRENKEGVEGNQVDASEDLVKNRLRKIEKHIMEIRLWRKNEFKIKQKKGLVTYPVHAKSQPRRRSFFKQRSRGLISRKTKSNNDIYDKHQQELQIEDVNESEKKDGKITQTPRNKDNKKAKEENQPTVNHKRKPVEFPKPLLNENKQGKVSSDSKESEEKKKNESKKEPQTKSTESNTSKAAEESTTNKAAKSVKESKKEEKKGVCSIL